MTNPPNLGRWRVFRAGKRASLRRTQVARLFSTAERAPALPRLFPHLRPWVEARSSPGSWIPSRTGPPSPPSPPAPFLDAAGLPVKPGAEEGHRCHLLFTSPKWHYEDMSPWHRAPAVGPSVPKKKEKIIIIKKKARPFPSSDVICLRRENNASRRSYSGLIREEGQAGCL